MDLESKRFGRQPSRSIVGQQDGTRMRPQAGEGALLASVKSKGAEQDLQLRICKSPNGFVLK